MEIERKFMVKSIPDNIDNYEKKEIEQSYISTSPTIRIRKSDSNFILTIKGKGSIAREEFELPISSKQYNQLLSKCETQIVSKSRYIVPIKDNLFAELDIYHGPLDGLYTVEVEFETISKAENFTPPDWFGDDISLDKRYKNTALSTLGMPI